MRAHQSENRLASLQLFQPLYIYITKESCVRFILCLLYNLYRARRFRGRIPKDGHEYREEDRNERHQSSSKWTGKSVVKCKYKIPLERPYHILSSPEHNLLPKIRPNILTEIISCKNSVVLLQQVYYYFCFSNV